MKNALHEALIRRACRVVTRTLIGKSLSERLSPGSSVSANKMDARLSFAVIAAVFPEPEQSEFPFTIAFFTIDVTMV